MGHTALGLQRHFEEVELADNPALAKSVGHGAYAPFQHMVQYERMILSKWVNM